MADYTFHHLRRGAVAGWCCSFAGVPQSPEHHSQYHPLASASTGASGVGFASGGPRKQQLPPVPKSPSSFHNSPSAKLAGLIDYPFRILSPGCVSPIKPDADPPLLREPEPAPFVAVREEEGLDLSHRHLSNQPGPNGAQGVGGAGAALVHRKKIQHAQKNIRDAFMATTASSSSRISDRWNSQTTTRNDDNIHHTGATDEFVFEETPH